MFQGGRSDCSRRLGKLSSELQEPISVRYRGFEVRQTPPNSTGFVLLQALKLVEAHLPRESAFLSADVAHLLIEAKKLAFVERERLGAEPSFAPIPVDQILAESYVAALAEEIDLRRSATRPVRPERGEGNTTYFCVVDRHGNAVSAIQSLNTCFGSGVLLEQ
ncbi:Glutathione hydrolase-like YwrD proenzyme (fragment) [Burkholderia sp. 8Y]